MAEKVDTLINARWLVPVEPPMQIIEQARIAIRDGRIVALGPRAEVDYDADATFDLLDHVVLPGFVNAHGHA
ncbi:MAG: TRZ/ATZ family hydrolase, partial [Gammaproteobacteria bacterium]